MRVLKPDKYQATCKGSYIAAERVTVKPIMTWGHSDIAEAQELDFEIRLHTWNRHCSQLKLLGRDAS